MLYPSSNLNKTERSMIKADLNQKNILDWDDDKYYNDVTKVTNSHNKILVDGGPEALEHYHLYGSEDKPAYAFGRAFHCLVLEKDTFYDKYFVFDDREKCIEIGGARPTATNKYKEWLDDIASENIGKEKLSIGEITILENMEAKLMSIPQVVAMLEASNKEVVYQATIDGVDCKGKIDAVQPNSMVIDLKTTASAPTLSNFRYDAKRYNYDRQMAFYARLADVPAACIIAIQKVAPYTVGVYLISEETMKIGEEKYQYALGLHKEQFRGNIDLDKFYYQAFL